MKTLSYFLFASLLFISCKDSKPTDQEKETASKSETVVQDAFKVHPVYHASMVLDWSGSTLYIDPVGIPSVYDEFTAPNIILVTDIHGDHMNAETLTAVAKEQTTIVAPQAVAEQLPEELQSKLKIVANGEIIDIDGFQIEAIPMYNLRESSLKFHEKGRGNGYVIAKNGKRVYISGDTEDIPEMLALPDIDVAFVCMNLPYTMTEIQAAKAVVAFKPKTVYPYHYKGAAGFSNIGMFKGFIKKSSVGDQIKVIDLDWYRTNK